MYGKIKQNGQAQLLSELLRPRDDLMSHAHTATGRLLSILIEKKILTLSEANEIAQPSWPVVEICYETGEQIPGFDN